MAITALLGDVANIVKGKSPGQMIVIDNKLFQMHYRFTSFIFFVFSIVSTANSLIGDPINCACADCERAGISKKMLDTHCWISGTYTVQAPSQHLALAPGFHGLGTAGGSAERKYHMYYQWVPFVLLMQGVVFYIPHWMWEINEDGRVGALVHQLRAPVVDKEALRKRVHQLTVYVVETLGSYDGYYLRFLVCDFFNIVNALVNLLLTHRFLNSEFLSYGPRCLLYMVDADQRAVNPMTETFPKLTKCQLQTFGPSGTVQELDAICVLALNIFNEKIYLLLWFWLLTLAIVTTLVFLLRSICSQLVKFRVPVFQRRAHTINITDIEDVVHHLKVSDFFFLSLLAKNMDITALRMFLSQLAKSVRRRQAFKGAALTAVRLSRRKNNAHAYRPVSQNLSAAPPTNPDFLP